MIGYNSFSPIGSFGLFGFFFTIAFLLIAGTIIVFLIRGISEWGKNNHSPKLTVPATIVSKRADVTSHRTNGANDIHHHYTATTYYVTFQFQSGDRMEFRIPDREYGLLVEGDQGDLCFQGTRYLNFERK